jgi:hypothetical protein
MSDLQFNISARDQASRVVAEVQKKVTEFGKDIGRSIVAVVGPMALLQAGFSAISSHLEDMKRKAADAFKWGSGLGENAAKLGLTVEEFQKVTAAANATGSSVEDVAKAYKLANDLLAQAKAGNKDAAVAIEGLGLSLEDVNKLTPELILQKLARALSEVPDPADKARLAVGALGKEAKDLQATLAKGFKIADAFKGLEGEGIITAEEAEFLRRQAADEKRAEMQEKAKLARKQVAERFLRSGDPAAQAIRDQATAEDQARRREMQSDPARLGYGGVGVYGRSIEALASDPKVQAQIIAALQAKERAGKVAESEVVLPGTAPNVGGLIQAGRNILEPPKPIKAETERAPTITVSSLRSIGGGVAGENLFVEQNIPKAQLDALQSIDKNIKILVGDKSPDLTKPPSGAPGSGLASNN